MKSDDQGDHFVSGGRIGGNRWRVSGLAMAEGIQTDMGRRAGRDNPCAVRDHSHPAKLPELWPRYAAYGGVFIILAVFWGWFVDRKTPDLYDWIGAVICLAGVSVMLWGPRS